MSEYRTNGNYRGTSRGGQHRGGYRGGHRGGFKSSGNDRRPREILFDTDAREQYLTGFHKRNLERKEKAVEHAKERERWERLEERREIRERKKQDLAERVEHASMMFKDQKLGFDASNSSDDESENEEDEEWLGIQDAADGAHVLKPILKGKRIQKYEKDDATDNSLISGDATVIIEDYDLDQDLTMPDRPSRPQQPDADEVLRKSLVRAALYADRIKKIQNGIQVPPKKKKKQFKYLTPTERKANKRKERTSRSKPM
ncbi:nucleolar protein 12-domain-containing protein [Lipomyces arxii]|uniref:nucleolar protein 12-domain-containing protein n=1 Tax=Lipomyces arxii TaxID=56418 RepID=UPI0034D00281